MRNFVLNKNKDFLMNWKKRMLERKLIKQKMLRKVSSELTYDNYTINSNIVKYSYFNI